MKASDLHDAIGQLPESMLAPVDKLRGKKRYLWVKWTAAAVACACLLLCIPQLFPAVKQDSMEKGEAAGNAYMYGCVDAECSMVADSANNVTRAVFQAKVLEILEGSLLVQPLPDAWELKSADKIVVPFSQLGRLPSFRVGDTVEITYSGTLLESYPAQAYGVIDIKIIE